MPAPAKQHLYVRSVEGVTVVGFADRMLVSEEVIQVVGEQLLELVGKKDSRNVLLDFSEVRFMSSALLGVLLPVVRKLTKEGGQLKLCSLAPPLKEVFEVSKLDRLFAICDNESAALAAF